ncbi:MULTISPECIES: hypothetical protein [unclassified Ruegeria]|nr:MULTISPECIES: hypothetical protein [unclassified Ruegeria]
MLSIVSPELKEQGICYHVPPEMKALAKSGKIQSGNLMVRLDLDIEDADREVTKRITDVTRENPDCDAFIFSSEYLFDRFPNTLPKIHQEFASKYNIVVIVVVREPTEMLTSLYSQLVKRHGFYGEVEQAAELVFHLTGAANVLTTCKSLGVQANVLNYSVEKKNISARLMSIFGVPDLLQAEAEKVLVSPSNRSLTYWETEIIKSINRVFGAKHGLKTSDALVEGLPDISSEVIEVSSSAVEKVIRQNAEAAKVVNEYLDANKKIRLLNKVGQSPAKHADLTEKQFDTVFEALHQSIGDEEQLQRDNEQLQRNNEQLQRDNEQLQRDNEQLQRDNEQLQYEKRHAQKYPWKYIRNAWQVRFGKGS